MTRQGLGTIVCACLCVIFIGAFFSANAAPTGCPPVTTPISANICPGDSLFFGGMYVSQPGIYEDSLLTSGGCDSVVILTLSLLPVYEDTLIASFCDGDSLLFGGEYLTHSGSYHDTLQSVGGCDSIIHLRLNVIPAFSDTIEASICPGDSLLYHGVYFSQPGFYPESYQSSQGCDSNVVLHLRIANIVTHTLSAGICPGDSILFGGQYQSTAGIYRDTLQSSLGCDSILTLVLSMLSPTTGNVNQGICPGQGIVFNDQYLTETGTYYDTLQGVNGCDSLVTLHLTVWPKYSDTLSASICEGDGILFGGNYYTTGGFYRDTLQTIHGCDSMVTLQLSIINSSRTAIVAGICDGNSLLFNGAYYSSSGMYNDTFQTVAGCDSIITLQLQVFNTYSDTILAHICAGDSLQFGGVHLSDAGSYRDTLPTLHGCDSVVTLQLNVRPNYVDTIDAQICMGRSFLFGGTFYSQPGYYSDSLQSVVGCDSVVVLHLEVKGSVSDSTTTSICQGDRIFFGGHYRDSAGYYVDTLVSVGGCDSIVTLELMVLDTFYTSVDTTIHQGDSILINNEYVSTAGIYRDTLIASNGCDSIIGYHLDVVIGVESPGPNPLNIYPNPTDGMLYLDFGPRDPGTVRVELFDLLGRKVLEATYDQSVAVKTIDLSHLPGGQYTLSVLIANGLGTTRKVILVR